MPILSNVTYYVNQWRIKKAPAEGNCPFTMMIFDFDHIW